MNILLILLLVAAMGATAYVLVRGVIAMASGKHPPCSINTFSCNCASA